MKLSHQIFCIVSMFLVSLFFARSFLGGAVLYSLNNSAYKKRKKGQSFKEWLFYCRFKEEIPKPLLILYNFTLFVHLIGLIACLLLFFFDFPSSIGRVIVTVVFYFDCIRFVVIRLLFWRKEPGFAYDRWITKKRGQKRKK